MEDARLRRICERKEHSVSRETSCHGVRECTPGTVLLWTVVTLCSGSEEAGSSRCGDSRHLEHRPRRDGAGSVD